jgi:hypothetical protein
VSSSKIKKTKTPLNPELAMALRRTGVARGLYTREALEKWIADREEEDKQAVEGGE